MTYSYSKIGDYYIVDLPGNALHKDNIDKLKSIINAIIEDCGINILLNFSKIDKIDGIGFGALLSIQKLALYYELNLKFFGLQPYVMQMFFQTRMNKIFEISSSSKEINDWIYKAENVDIVKEALRDDILVA